MDEKEFEAICINNSGTSSSYGVIENIISIGEKVKVLYTNGCCYKIQKANGEEYTLNRKIFKKI
jgi:hypothetical protein